MWLPHRELNTRACEQSGIRNHSVGPSTRLNPHATVCEFDRLCVILPACGAWRQWVLDLDFLFFAESLSSNPEGVDSISVWQRLQHCSSTAPGEADLRHIVLAYVEVLCDGLQKRSDIIFENVFTAATGGPKSSTCVEANFKKPAG